MKTITIITPSNIEVEYRLAGAGSRLAAFIVDFTIQMLLIFAVILIVLYGTDRIGDEFGFDGIGIALGIVMVITFIIHFGYFIFSELATNGQSIGKRIFGLRVIRGNGQPIGFSQSLIRGLLRATLDMIYVGLFVILFSKQHKRLGDMAAGTLVIAERYDSADEAVSVANHWLENLPEKFLLSPEELKLTEEWLRRRDDMLDGGESVRVKLMEHLAKYQQD
jgi:uncharacterized RDD family membrane protein YckC